MSDSRTSTKLRIPHTTDSDLYLVGVLEQITSRPLLSSGPRTIALILHGSGGHKDYLFQKRLSQRLNLDSFRFDFRGCHESPGVWRQGTLLNDVEDIQIVVNYLSTTYGYKVDLVVGHSRGSIVAMRWMCTTNEGQQVSAFVNLSGRYRTQKILETGLYQSTQTQSDFAEKGYTIWRPTIARKVVEIKIYPEDFEMFAAFNTSLVWSRFPQVTDVFTIHGLRDQTVPPYDAVIYSRALGNRSPGTHSLNLVEEADHNFTGRQDEVVDMILEWWDAHLRRELRTGIWMGSTDVLGKL